MLLDGGFAVFGLVFLLGLFVFLGMGVAMVLRFIGFVFRSIFGIDGPGGERPRGGLIAGPTRRCHGVNCAHQNLPRAHFCARCGRRLDPLPKADFDDYG